MLKNEELKPSPYEKDDLWEKIYGRLVRLSYLWMAEIFISLCADRNFFTKISIEDAGKGIVPEWQRMNPNMRRSSGTQNIRIKESSLEEWMDSRFWGRSVPFPRRNISSRGS